MAQHLQESELASQRRAARVGIELPARCKHGLTRSTVMLKDLTPYGARIEGIGSQRIGDVVTLLLPGLKAKTAFVVWSEASTAGLEFDHPLHSSVFDSLVSDYAIGQMRRQARHVAPAQRFAA
ncbi:MAG: hypothetical protein RIS94_2137 [Pseudomonadota bacterium]|jgi:hypothetical protein